MSRRVISSLLYAFEAFNINGLLENYFLFKYVVSNLLIGMYQLLFFVVVSRLH